MSEGHIPQCKFMVQQNIFHYDCKILPLKGYDMVLGANWLKHHSPNYTDWEKRSIAITVNNQWVTLFDRAAPLNNKIISAKACSKLLATGAQAYLIRIQPPQHQPEGKAPPDSQLTDNPVADILAEFTDIF